MKKNLCIYHSRDLDGWMSAAIVKRWSESRENILPVEFLGWEYGNTIPEWEKYYDIFMCDVSFPAEEMLNIQKSGKGFIWCDHHVSAIIDVEKLFTKEKVELPFGIRDTKFAACELTWKNCFPDETMPEIVRLLGRYDCFGHKGTDEETKVLEFQYGARNFWSNHSECYAALTSWDENQEHTVLMAGHHIYNYLCTEAKQTYSKAFRIDLPSNFDGNDEGEHLPYRFLVVNQERFNPINFGIDYHNDGYDGFACFWYKDGKWMFSLYNDNGEVDCSAIAKTFGGGGHKGASGFVWNKDIKEIIG